MSTVTAFFNPLFLKLVMEPNRAVLAVVAFPDPGDGAGGGTGALGGGGGGALGGGGATGASGTDDSIFSSFTETLELLGMVKVSSKLISCKEKISSKQVSEKMNT